MNAKLSDEKPVGTIYQRNRFEVHERLYIDNKWGAWRSSDRSPETIEAARQSIAASKRQDASLKGFIDMGRTEYRIVKVTATCEVVELIK